MNNITKLTLAILLRKDNQIFFPMDEIGYPKLFLFNMNTDELRKMSTSEFFQESLFVALFNGLHLNEFFIQVFPEDFDFFLASASFDFQGSQYSFNYLDDYYPDNFGWREDPKLFLGEEFGRIELDIYNFDDYIESFGMDESNLNYLLEGKVSEGGLYLANKGGSYETP